MPSHADISPSQRLFPYPVFGRATAVVVHLARDSFSARLGESLKSCDSWLSSALLTPTPPPSSHCRVFVRIWQSSTGRNWTDSACGRSALGNGGGNATQRERRFGRSRNGRCRFSLVSSVISFMIPAAKSRSRPSCLPRSPSPRASFASARQDRERWVVVPDAVPLTPLRGEPAPSR